MNQQRVVRSRTCGVKQSAVKPLEYDETKAAYERFLKKRGLPTGKRFSRMQFNGNHAVEGFDDA